MIKKLNRILWGKVYFTFVIIVTLTAVFMGAWTGVNDFYWFALTGVPYLILFPKLNKKFCSTKKEK